MTTRCACLNTTAGVLPDKRGLPVTASHPDDAMHLLLPGMRRLGFGCGDLYGGASRAQSVRLIETALDQGIQYFDLARLYGNGSAEAVMGSILPRFRSRVIITSKAGILPYSMLRAVKFKARARKAIRLLGPIGRALVAAPPPSAARFGAFGLRDLRRSVHRSLRDLRTGHLDVLLLHECTVADAVRPEVIDFLERLRAQGKIRAFGIATHFPDTCRILEEAPLVAQIAQFASDASNRNIRRLPAGKADLVVTHTAIKQILPRLIACFATDAAAASRWHQRTGIAADDRAGIARLLLTDAVAENPDGIVLFSTARPERVAEACSLGRHSEEVMAALHDAIEQLRAAAATSAG